MATSQRGTRPYHRALAALTLFSLATFSMIYVVQPNMVLLSQEFGVNASATSWTLSISTLFLALAVIPLARAAGPLGRGRIMTLASVLAVACTLASALAPTFALVLVARALAGLGFAGVTGVALAWVAEEASPVDSARLGGLYVAGTTVGGMTGRLLGGALAEVGGWRLSVGGVGVVCAAFVVAAVVLLPRAGEMARARGEDPDALRAAREGRRARAAAKADAHAENAAAARRLTVDLWRMYTVGGLGMFAFVGVYTAIVFRAAAPPLHMGPGVTSLFFLTYLAGTVISARAGAIAERVGTRRAIVLGMGVAALGVLITMPTVAVTIWLGLLVMSAGFFLAHALAASTGPRIAPVPAQASSRYTFAYYTGSSAGGVALGAAWDLGGWWAVTAGALIALALAAHAARGLSAHSGTAPS